MEEWRRRDPLDRVRAYLRAQGEWDQDWEDEVETAEAEALEAAVAEAEAEPDPGPDDVFGGMFAEVPPSLAAQRALLARDRGRA